MKKLIAYKNSDGNIAIVYPVLECGLTLEQIAQKDTPSGAPYLIADESDIPSDHTNFNAWVADFSSPDGHGLGAELFFSIQANADEAKQAITDKVTSLKDKE